jgi:hypothetical protein
MRQPWALAGQKGPPGIRENYNANYYGAFARDLDGNKIEAVTFTARESFGLPSQKSSGRRSIA